MAYSSTSSTAARAKTQPLVIPLHPGTFAARRSTGDPLGSLSDRESSSPVPQTSKRALSKTYEPEKRKRCRVTPEQLTHLENFFANESSPSATRRREISDFLGMNERQTQIWFQNRRAKAKQLLEKRKAAIMDELSPNHTVCDAVGNDVDVDIVSVVHEDGPITPIPCTDLTIGTWRRVSTSSRFDLVAYKNHRRHCLAWYIQSAGYGFKMEIPYGFIAETDLVPSPSGLVVLVVTLSQAPLFYMETADTTAHGGTTWSQCSDWTEGHQASAILRHELLGNYAQLSQVAADLKAAIPPALGTARPGSHLSVDIAPPTVTMSPSTAPSSPGGSSASQSPSLATYPHSQPDNDLYPISRPTPHTQLQTQEPTNSNPVLTLNASGNSHSYSPTGLNRPSSGLRISSAPADALTFFPVGPADSAPQHGYETYRRHSSHIPTYTWPLSPSSPPPAIAYARRGSPDDFAGGYQKANSLAVLPRPSSQPQPINSSGFQGTFTDDKSSPAPVDFSESGSIDAHPPLDDVKLSTERQALVAQHGGYISYVTASSIVSSDREGNIPQHYFDSRNDHSTYVYSPQPFICDDTLVARMTPGSYYASPVPLTPEEYGTEHQYTADSESQMVPMIDSTGQWFHHSHQQQ